MEIFNYIFFNQYLVLFYKYTLHFKQHLIVFLHSYLHFLFFFFSFWGEMWPRCVHDNFRKIIFIVYSIFNTTLHALSADAVDE